MRDKKWLEINGALDYTTASLILASRVAEIRIWFYAPAAPIFHGPRGDGVARARACAEETIKQARPSIFVKRRLMFAFRCWPGSSFLYGD